MICGGQHNNTAQGTVLLLNLATGTPYYRTFCVFMVLQSPVKQLQSKDQNASSLSNYFLKGRLTIVLETFNLVDFYIKILKSIVCSEFSSGFLSVLNLF